jgi:hypothetical protein
MFLLGRISVTVTEILLGSKIVLLCAPQIEEDRMEAEKSYESRAKRCIAAYQVEKPDRVPVSLPPGNWPAYLAGTDLKTVMYDYGKLSQAWKKYYSQYETDRLETVNEFVKGDVGWLFDKMEAAKEYGKY